MKKDRIIKHLSNNMVLTMDGRFLASRQLRGVLLLEKRYWYRNTRLTEI